MIAFTKYTTSATFKFDPVGEIVGCLLDCTNGDVTITLPTPTASMEGCQVALIKTDDTLNEAFVTTESGQTWNGTAYTTYYSPYARLDLFMATVINQEWYYVYNEWVNYP